MDESGSYDDTGTEVLCEPVYVELMSILLLATAAKALVLSLFMSYF